MIQNWECIKSLQINDTELINPSHTLAGGTTKRHMWEQRINQDRRDTMQDKKVNPSTAHQKGKSTQALLVKQQQTIF